MGEELYDQEIGQKGLAWSFQESFYPHRSTWLPSPPRSVYLHCPRSSAASNLGYPSCSLLLRPLSGSRWLPVQTNEYFPTQRLRLRRCSNLLGSYYRAHRVPAWNELIRNFPTMYNFNCIEKKNEHMPLW